MNQAQALYRLQEIDLNLLRRLKRLNEIDAALADDQAVAGAQAQVAAHQQALAPLRAKVRNLELEIQSTVQKAKATEDQLYSGTVRNPKQMQEMQQEIEALGRRRSELEDTLLEAFEAVEGAEDALSAAEAQLSDITAARGNDLRHLLDEQQKLRAEVVTLRAQRDTALGAVSPESLTLYNSLRPKKHNQPVAVLEDETCSACGVEQTMAITREVRLGQSLVKCLSCGRILVVKG